MHDKTHPTRAAAVLLLTAVLAGCGIDRGGAPIAVTFTPVPDATTDAVAGPISSKSDTGVVIAGTAIDVRSALIQINGMAADLSQLQVGHYAVVEAAFSDADNAVATLVDVTFEVIGPVDAVQGDALTVLGQRVVIGADTVLDDALAGLDLSDPADVPGVTVSGFADGAGTVLATRVGLDTTGALRLTGFASDVQPASFTLSIGAQPVDYSAAALIALASAAPVAGGRLTATFEATGPDLRAEALISAPIVPATLAAGAQVRIAGFVTTFANDADFSVAFTPAQLARGATVANGTAADLELGRLVIASGTLSGDRRLEITDLQFID